MSQEGPPAGDTRTRVFVAGDTEMERRAVAARVAGDPRWVVVSDPARADVVAVSPETWARTGGGSAQGAPDLRAVAVEALTSREREVLVLVADGLHNREVAERLGVSEHTIKFHLGAIFGKLGASTRTEAVQKGLRMGLIAI